MRKKVTAFILVLGLCLTTAFAAYGAVAGDTITGNNNSLYWGDDGVLHTLYRHRMTSTTTETSASASNVANIYVKASIADVDSNEVYVVSEGLDHYKTEVSTTTDYFEYKEEDPEITISFIGLHRARYSDDTVSEKTSGHLQTSVGNSSRVATLFTAMDGNMQESQLGAKPEHEIQARKQILDNFDVNLSEHEYVSFSELWMTEQEELAPELRPLKSILMDAFAAAQVGDHLPAGVLYKGVDAYTVQETADGTLRLTKYCVDINSAQARSTDGAELLNCADLLPDDYAIFLNDYSIVDVTVK